ncbi:hypothetical protein HELRODRAFT_80870 [Helobdella robusta]|uniref:Cyclic nucleotide-binding domain-containing protein n=1 Tax=Helobdella robusta TaxID=6412 RepID=T1G466_HELRO|nr:hypothetical protein HELRODRAFT_80870 [Helobdella robusta]ESO02998.1 hypothetical protein HELRODRAFT_80870 [Helobdella robusta]
MLQDSEDTINSSLPSIYNKLHSSPRCIILHYSPFKAVWDWITLLFVVYTAFLTPYITAFCLNKDFSKSQLNLDPSLRLAYAETSSVDPLVIVDVIIDIVFLFDIFINFRTTFLLNGDVISDPQKIAINYIKSWFFIDAIAAIPFDLLLFGSGTSSTTTIAGILKISRLIRLVRVAKKIDQFSEYGAAVLLLLLATFVLISHWLACIFYVIAFIERPTLHAPIGWLDYLANITGKPFLKNETFSGPDIRSIYITSLYFTYTILTSVGFGNIAPITNLEKIFSIFAMMLGSLMSAVIFGNVSSIMLRIYQGSGEQQELQMSIKEFIRFHAIPKSLANRLLESHEQSRNFTSGIDMNSVLKSFPDCMQADICLHLNRKLLSSNEAFSQASPGCIRALSMKFKSTHAPPGDTLIHPGDILSSIYFIARGSIEISRNGNVICQLNKDDSFGQNIGSSYLEDGQWKALKKSAYSVIISSYSDLHKISVQDLRNILDMYPEFSQRFLEKFHVTFDLGELLDVS